MSFNLLSNVFYTNTLETQMKLIDNFCKGLVCSKHEPPSSIAVGYFTSPQTAERSRLIETN